MVMLIYSCSSPENVNSNKPSYNQIATLHSQDSVLFELDSTQGFYSNNINQLEIEGNQFITLFNQMTGKLYYYNLKTGATVKITQYEMEGPNGIGAHAEQITHLPIGMDSVFIYNGWDLRGYLFDGLGSKLKTFDFASSSIFESEGPFVISITNDNRPYRIGNKIYFNCQSVPARQFGKKPVLLALNLKTAELQGIIIPPNSYSDYCWGVNYSTNVFSTYHAERKQFIMSYGVESDLYVYDSTGREKDRVNNGSKFFGSIEPYSSNVKDYMNMSSYEKRMNHSMLNPKYYKLLHFSNQDNEYFLRETFLPRKEEDIQAGINNLRKSFIISDKNLNQTGEYLVPEQYMTSLFFTSSKGVYLADLNYYYKNEGFLKFDLFTLKVLPNE